MYATLKNVPTGGVVSYYEDEDFCDDCNFLWSSCACLETYDVETGSLTQCQGCGSFSYEKPGTPHNCFRNEDGSYEEGGTFQ